MRRTICSVLLVILAEAASAPSAPAAPLWIYRTPGDAPLCLAALPDTTGDQPPEIVVGYDSGRIACLRSGAKKEPDILWSATASGAILALQPLGDANADGFSEIVAATDLGNVVCLNAGGPSAGKILWSFPAVFNCDALTILKDINGDGVRDVAFGGADHRVTLLSGKDGQRLWSRFFETIGYNISFVDRIANAGDLNGDGKEDLFVRTWGANRWAISGAGGSDIWPRKPGDPFLSTLAVAKDVNGDGILEFIESGNDGVLYMHNGKDGSEIWRCELGRPVRAVEICDHVVSANNFFCYAGNAEGKISCVLGNGKRRVTPQWTRDIGDVCRSIVTLGDLEKDCILDIVAGAENGKVAAFSGATGREFWQWRGPDAVRTLLRVKQSGKKKRLCDGLNGEDQVSDIAAAFIDGSVVLLPGAPDDFDSSETARVSLPAKKERMHAAPSPIEIQEVPILLYHDVPPRGFRAAIPAPCKTSASKWISWFKRDHTAVSLDEIADWIDKNGALPAKPVCITFDGQYASHFTYLLKILQDHKLFGISYITTDWIGTPNHLDWHQLRGWSNPARWILKTIQSIILFLRRLIRMK